VKSNPPNDPDGDGFNMVKGRKAKKKPIVCLTQLFREL